MDILNNLHICSITSMCKMFNDFDEWLENYYEQIISLNETFSSLTFLSQKAYDSVPEGSNMSNTVIDMMIKCSESINEISESVFKNILVNHQGDASHSKRGHLIYLYL